MSLSCSVLFSSDVSAVSETVVFHQLQHHEFLSQLVFRLQQHRATLSLLAQKQWTYSLSIAKLFIIFVTLLQVEAGKDRKIALLQLPPS